MRWFWNWGWIVGYATLLALSVVWVTVQNQGPAQEAQPEKITLTFRHFWNKEHDKPVLAIFESVVRTYEKAHPNVKVNFESIDQTIHREQKLKSEMVTGTPPDMFVLFGGAEIVPYARSNRLMDLTEFLENAGLREQFKDLHHWTFNNRVYGLPFEGHAEPIYYNRALFQKLHLEPPKTMEELDEVIRVLQANDKIPFALGNEDRWPAGIFAHYFMDRYAGPELIDRLVEGEDGVSFQHQSYLKAFEKLEQWISEGAFSPHANDLSTEEAIAQFTEGKAAMYLNGSWDITLFRNEDHPDFQNEVGVIPFPSLHSGEERSLAGGYTIGIGLSSDLDEPKKQAALELLGMFYTTEVQTRLVYEGLRVPSMKITYDSKKTGPVFAQVTELMEDSASTFLPYDNKLSPEVNSSFLKVIEDMIGGRIDADNALEQIQKSSIRYWQLRRNTVTE
ncbi:ABC transporter substrate-binding protein [Paenibacillus glucanolyticus]|uniref:ABC transporter substrate-binding protein n=1 Tax=Paenibacillus TaxID=44249 RepID=UPI0003E1CF4D|nr:MULTISPECIES: extracellular solute-binding protein [Paenibacillus]ANA80961.1 ABC transporter substrate-binding protein [Paenibacillus glucanolyticus]AVV54967.1 ABC transporter substrate-binding protein [Paenibacillus glucanolyticus]ETT36484.1 family 1 extracellular solute-binding protein [Paenibacillus sp. FSL R5-808]